MQDAANKTESKYLSFQLGAETYAIEILKVREIIGLLEITAVPKTAAHIRGVVNLRGKIVPVLDMRAKFGLPAVEARRENCIITVMAEAAAGPLPQYLEPHGTTSKKVPVLTEEDKAMLKRACVAW